MASDIELAMLKNELSECKAQLVKYEQDYRSMAVAHTVQVPEPGTDAAKLMISARIARQRAGKIETEVLKVLAENDELKIKNEQLEAEKAARKARPENAIARISIEQWDHGGVMRQVEYDLRSFEFYMSRNVAPVIFPGEVEASYFHCNSMKLHISGIVTNPDKAVRVLSRGDRDEKQD